jgi:2-iminobutanoate/2-iminopropanoate deaminase
MTRQIISTPDAPSSPLYSQGVKVGTQIFVSGMVGIDASTGELAGATVRQQTAQALLNCEHILRAGGASRDDIVDVGVLLVNPADFAAFNEEYATFFAADKPARYVAKLGVDIPNILVSIRMTAVTD